MQSCRIVWLALAVSIAFLMTGCGTSRLSERATNPVIKDYLHTSFASQERQVGLLATGSSHRIITTRLDDGEPQTENKWQKGEYCAEPPPDAAVSVASILSTNASLTGLVGPTDDKTNANITANYYRSLATAVAPLLRRSQGLQWNRDNMAILCNAYSNRFLTQDQYHELLKTVLKKSARLISDELKKLPKFDLTIAADGSIYHAPTPVAPTGMQTAPSTPISAEEANKKAAEAKKKAEAAKKAAADAEKAATEAEQVAEDAKKKEADDAKKAAEEAKKKETDK